MMPDLLVIIAVLFALLSVAFFIACTIALKKRKIIGTVMNFTVTLLMLSLSLLCGTISIATQGYRALTHEELAAIVEIKTTGHQRFKTRFRFPDNSESEFELAGDELYVDAHILKWKPFANIFGLKTVYELNRVAGRYSSLENERTKPRTVFALSRDKPIDMFDLIRKYKFLAPFLDAEYGSATFISVSKAAKIKVMVSTTGLLIRIIN